MVAIQTHSGSSNGRLSDYEIRGVVLRAKEQGLIRDGNAPRVIEKNGVPVTAAGKLCSQWVEITPAMALQWLENNFRNRPVSDDVVAAYARDMANGTWVATHQGIAFNDKDELIDGQHRLYAIVQCGKTVRTMVTFGLPSTIEGKEMTTMDAVDRGRTRSVADQLKIQHGMKDGSVIAALCASLGWICYGERTRRLSVGQTLEIYRAFEGSITWAIANRSKEHGLRATGVLAAFAFARAGYGNGSKAAAITAMYERLVAGKGLKAGAPLSKLRLFLTSDDAMLLTRRNDRALGELVMGVLKAELEGAPVPKLEICPSGLSHFRALQKERVTQIGRIFTLPEAKA